MTDQLVEIKSGHFKIEVFSDKLQIKNFLDELVGILQRSHFLRGRKTGEAGDIVSLLEAMPWYTDSIGEDILEALEDYWGVK